MVITNQHKPYRNFSNYESGLLSLVMERRGGGSIVNISSILGIRAIPKVPFSVYGVTKAGVIMFTKSIAVEYGQYNIGCQLHCSFNYT